MRRRCHCSIFSAVARALAIGDAERAVVGCSAAFARMVGEYLWDALRDGSLTEAIEVTLRRLLIGYTIGVVIGLPLGLLTSTSEYFEDTIGALALGLQTLPSVCWVRCAALVRPVRGCHAVRGGDGYGLVRGDRH